MPATRLQKARRIRDETNAAAFVNRLSPELIAEIMIHGLPSRHLDCRERWRDTKAYLQTIGAVSSGWRHVRQNTTTLWTFVGYILSSYKRIRQKRLKLLDLFFLHSKGSVFELYLDSAADIPPPDVANHIRNHLHRCHTLLVHRIISQKNSIFPLPVNTTALNTIVLDLAWNFGRNESLPLFEDIPQSGLRSFACSSFKLIGFQYFPSDSITTLNFRTSRLSASILSFASQCPLLEELHIGSPLYAFESLERGDASNLPTFSFPHLTSLQVEDDFPLTFDCILSTPLLRHLSVDVYDRSSAPQKPFEGHNLHTLRIEAERFKTEIVEYILSQRHLRAIEFRLTPGVLEFAQALRASDHDPDGLNEDGERIDMPCSSLRLIRIYIDHMPPSVNPVALLGALEEILRQRPWLRVEGHLMNDRDLLGSADHAMETGRLLLTTCRADGVPCFTPVSELFKDGEGPGRSMQTRIEVSAV